MRWLVCLPGDQQAECAVSVSALSEHTLSRLLFPANLSLTAKLLAHVDSCSLGTNEHRTLCGEATHTAVTTDPGPCPWEEQAPRCDQQGLRKQPPPVGTAQCQPLTRASSHLQCRQNLSPGGPWQGGQAAAGGLMTEAPWPNRTGPVTEREEWDSFC